ncbi:MAG: ATP-binding protein [Phaeodactylibacter sp.]|nr:ATP-binding protein [Phaeodactylibacter sp.]
MKILRIAITGPESTGKSTLSKALAEHFDAPLVPEYARDYLDTLGKTYSQDDFLQIARGQIALENQELAQAEDLIIYDTDMLVLKIWSLRSYGTCPDFIQERLLLPAYDFHFLCGTDVPWAFDPLREHPDDRASLYAQYLDELTQLNLPFTELEGSHLERLRQAIHQIRELLALEAVR